MKTKLILALFLFLCCFQAIANNLYIGSEFQQRKIRYYHQPGVVNTSRGVPQHIVFTGIDVTDNLSLEVSHQSLIGGRRLILLSPIPSKQSICHGEVQASNDILKVKLLRLKGPTLSLIWRFPLTALPSTELIVVGGVSSLKAIFERNINEAYSKHTLYAYGLKLGAGAIHRISEHVYWRGMVYFEHPHFFNFQESSLSNIFSSIPRYSVGLMYKF